MKIIKRSKKLFELYYSYRKDYPTRTRNELKYIINNSKKVSELLNSYRVKNPICLQDDVSDYNDDYDSDEEFQMTKRKGPTVNVKKTFS